MIGQKISHYKILEKLGEGGMGVVYKAEDTKLKRLVALKFLPRELIKDQESKERFLTEAQAAAGLNHSNIVTIHEINEHDDQVYIVMELVQGKNLKEKIRSGQLQIDEVLKIAKQLSRGLEEAHKKEVIHRDIKSANIMISESGQIKILDFGLARLKNQSGVTKAGTTLGTTAYMSPEQTNGITVDHRSDIWSLGVVIYEMLTRSLPFKGEYEQAVIYSILNEDPNSVSTYRPDVQNELEQIIRKTLAKSLEDRYQSAGELLEDIRKLKEDSTSGISPSKSNTTIQSTNKSPRRILFIAVSLLLSIVLIWFFIQWQSKSEVKPEDLISNTVNKKVPESKRKMIVVLPFENLGSPDDEYFADGITEEITARLSRLKGLGVIARISANQYKKTTKTLQIIGKELGVDYLVKGTIRWQRSKDRSSRVRITPQLIKTSDATSIWAEVYDRDLTDIFAVQAFIAEKVASSLDITLLEGQRKNMSIQPTKNMEAYNYYLRGKSLFERDSKESTQFDAIKMYKKAIELDPQYTEAWASLSTMHSNLFWFYFDRSDERVAKAKYAVDRAFELKPGFPKAYKALGDYYYHCKLDYKNALEQYNIARKGLGENSDLYSYIGFVKRRQGKWTDAVNYLTKAFKLNPLSTSLLRNLAETHSLVRNYPKAKKLFKLSDSLNLGNLEMYGERIQDVLLREGDTVKGIALLDESFQKFSVSNDPYFIFSELLLHICHKNYQEILDRLSTFPKESIETQFSYIPKVMISASVHQLLKQPDLARREYERAFVIIQDRLKKNPKDSRLHSSLGIILAGLGKKDKGIKEGKLGIELMPINKEAYRGFYRVMDLARIYTMVGKNQKAIDQIEYLLSIAGPLSKELLRIDPRWNPLRKNPRFKKLLKDGKQYSYIANDQ